MAHSTGCYASRTGLQVALLHRGGPYALIFSSESDAHLHGQCTTYAHTTGNLQQPHSSGLAMEEGGRPRPQMTWLGGLVRGRAPFNNSAPLGVGGGPTPPIHPPCWIPTPPLKDWANFSFRPSADRKFSLACSAPISFDQKSSSLPLTASKNSAPPGGLGGGGGGCWTHPPTPEKEPWGGGAPGPK